MNYVDICPPSVVYRIQEADLRSSADADLITWVEVTAGRKCAIAALEPIAKKLKADSDLSVVDLFFNAVAGYAPMLDDTQKDFIREAYLHFPYNPAISGNYFLGLRYARIDLRDELKGHVRINWGFKDPDRNAATWDYYLYLAAMDEPGALDAISDKIADTKNGNDATLLLLSLADLHGKEVDAILQSYANDSRTADGVSGPGRPISKTIERLMRTRTQ